MRRPVASAFWVGVLGALGLFDYWCAKNATEGDSLSEVARATFRTHTPLGRVLLVTSWTGLSLWLLPHLCRVVRDASPALSSPLEGKYARG